MPMEAFREPLIEKKVDLDSIYSTKRVKREPITKWRKSLENALIYRKPWAFVIDEAQHLTKIGSGRRLMNQMDTIKSLASMSKVTPVLIGTYDLLAFRNLSGQLSRRSINLHFSRYRAEYPEELKIFKNVLVTFQKHLPLEKEPDLVGEWEYFYERSIGCIGVLKDWLLRTYRSKLSHSMKTITMDDFDDHAYSIDQCIRMIQEARTGEDQLEESEEKQNNLSVLVGLGQETTSQNEEKIEKRKSNKVGQRKPKRDRVGGVKDVQ